MYQDIIVSIFAISWLSERIYYYCIHNGNNKSQKELLNLNTPLASSYRAQYNPITLPDNEKEKNNELNDIENQSHL